MTGSSKIPFRVKANQLAPKKIAVATAPNSALQTAEIRGNVTVNARDSVAAANNSAPGAQSGRLRNAPDRICSSNCASASTPGVEGLSGVATTSDSSDALAPTTTILPSRSERSVPG